MKKVLFLLFFLPYILQAQLITTQPEVLTENKKATIIFNAAEGNKGLIDFTGDVYAHTGVITDKSTSGGDWKYGPSKWGDNSSKYKLTSLGNNLWQLDLTPNIRNYYGVPEGETILKLAFVFRSADTFKEGKDTGNGDIFITLNESRTQPIVKQRPANLTDGINYIDNQSATLLLYAPGKKHVHLMGDFNDWKKDNTYQLYKDGDYWWFTLNGLEKGKEYGFQYLIDNDFKIADAYTEKILDPNYDKDIPATTYPALQAYPLQTEGIVSILKTGKQAYNWQTKSYSVAPKEDLVIYELLIRDFTKEGTIKAAQAKLDYLQALGVNAIELMPIQEFDGNDSWGYNPCFFFAADKAYGTPDDYKAFIDEAHKRGIAVLLDVVFNHATGQHPFARLYWEDNAPATDNPWFNRSAPHPYNVFNDFNHEYTGTRAFFKRVLTHWINEYKIDGFRFDLTKGFTQKQSTESTAGNYDASRIAILKDYNSHIKSVKPDTYVILEHFCENKEEKELAEAGMMLWNNVNHAYSQSLMGWKEQSDLTSGSYTYRGWTIPALITYAESHDEERLVYRAKTWGNWSMKDDKALQMKRSALDAAFLFCTPGPKMIWQFGELGYDISIDYNGRTGKKPVHWEYYDDTERKKLYETYSALLKFRAENASLFSAPVSVDMQTAIANWSGGRAIRLKSTDKELVLLGNFIESSIDIPAGFTSTGTWEELFTGESLNITEANKNSAITLAPHSFKLFTPKNLTANESVAAERSVQVYYDKSSSQIRVNSPHPVEQLSIYNISGTLVKKWKAVSTYSVLDLPSGMYIVETQVLGSRYYDKFIR
ncbi:1,4-alpha-glucan branching enzyme [Parabacteroides sp. PF5-5]|uniref:alpha-amylase family glycosyl hydrolase n=1 Tax=unclassified Parabacteroides TaxID=2649774 RepID=UPI002474D074|nr:MULTISPECIES: alpha-amylase family glycosyl hydrolase [unclassified Parabacteroides]MDH6314369.1 1,4-alpha-glucan branching enzyme [Parabacteroides sp. PF5-13]MDH6325779.1 1,4-alpha-glucan branching enzyme [Parabacteroides sp. PH5-41]MDH6333358.1 1,4-alpha-glucan branching enzyme [Parabacteroides sp. PF5-5]MDH6359379.1 1,4-alpha-glucan branching enzyme [Parabacteroides sp. PH5-16]MDH6375044.1 1,4-alpha-glucan branching enzyme [Parabacteroides sp. PH5-33]